MIYQIRPCPPPPPKVAPSFYSYLYQFLFKLNKTTTKKKSNTFRYHRKQSNCLFKKTASCSSYSPAYRRGSSLFVMDLVSLIYALESPNLPIFEKKHPNRRFRPFVCPIGTNWGSKGSNAIRGWNFAQVSLFLRQTWWWQSFISILKN